MRKLSTSSIYRSYVALGAGTVVAVCGGVSQGNITVSITANGNLDPTTYTYASSGAYFSFGSGSYNGVAWNNLAVGQEVGNPDELSVGAVGVTNTAASGGMVEFAAVDNNFVLPVNALAAELQTAFNGDLNGGASGDSAGLLGGAGEAAGTVPAVSQTGSQTFTNPPYSQAFSQTEANQSIRSAGIGGAMSIYADADANFNAPGYLGNISTVANVFPGAVTIPEPATLGLVVVASAGLLLIGRRAASGRA